MFMFVYLRWVGGKSNVYVNIFEGLKFRFSSEHIGRDIERIVVPKNLPYENKSTI